MLFWTWWFLYVFLVFGTVFCVLAVRLVGWSTLMPVRTHVGGIPGGLNRFVLFGDSILDNGPYTGVEGCVSQILVAESGKTVHLCALDGDVIEGIEAQLDADVYAENTMAFVSMGGNNALQLLGEIHLAWPWKPLDAVSAVWRFVSTFQSSYEQSLLQVLERYPETVAFNVYNLSHPHKQHVTRPLVGLLNMSIEKVCRHHGVPVIDVFTMFNRPEDYAPSSPDAGDAPMIEPSANGAQKIVSCIINASIAGSGTFYKLSNAPQLDEASYGCVPLFEAFGPGRRRRRRHKAN